MKNKFSKIKTILVIDDIKSNLQLIQVLIAKKFPEYSVLLADSGEEGIQLALEHKPEVILLDIIMPKLSGFEVCEKLKSTPSVRHIPILIISALGSDPNIRIKSLEIGADAFLNKPFNHSEFETMINVLLRIKNAEDDLRRKNNTLLESIKEKKVYQDKLKRLNTELGEAEEKERKMIADFLHDGLAQNLSIANIKLSALKNMSSDTQSLSLIEETTSLISGAISEIRSVIYDLNLPILNELGLISALRWKLEQIQKTLPYKFNFQSEVDEKEIKEENKVLLYRIISELITNITKHAHADYITLLIEIDDINMYCTISDNGTGFTKTQNEDPFEKGKYGLFSIRERLDTINGRLIIKSKEGVGTKITVQTPK